jgi:hypothetical protein
MAFLSIAEAYKSVNDLRPLARPAYAFGYSAAAFLFFAKGNGCFSQFVTG